MNPDVVGSYSFGDVVELTSATRSNLITWTDRGIVRASEEETAGPGHHRRFSLFNLVEAELCAAINRFKVPVALLGDAANTLRWFHRRQLAVTQNRPAVETASRLFTPAQRKAYLDAVVEELHIKNSPYAGRAASRANYRKLMDRPDHLTESVQSYALRTAEGWESFLGDPQFRKENFCGLFVVPQGRNPELQWDEDDTQIRADWETGRIDLTWALSNHAIVINLDLIITAVETRTGKRL